MKKLIATLIALFTVVPAFASLGVAPTKIEYNANKIKNNFITTAIEVKGDTQKAMRFKVYPVYFTIDSKGDAVFHEKSSDEFDLSKKVRFVPSEFSVAPGKVQKVRVNVANIKQLPDGESRTMLFIEDVNPKEMNIPTPHAGIGAQLIVKTRVGVPLYIDKGKFVKEAEIEYFNIVKAKDGLYTDMKILSKGNSRIRYSTNIQISQGKKLVDEYSLPSFVVGQNNYYIDKQKINTKKLAAGQYTLRAVISYYDENGKKKNIKQEKILNIQGNI